MGIQVGKCTRKLKTKNVISWTFKSMNNYFVDLKIRKPMTDVSRGIIPCIIQTRILLTVTLGQQVWNGSIPASQDIYSLSLEYYGHEKVFEIISRISIKW